MGRPQNGNINNFPNKPQNGNSNNFPNIDGGTVFHRPVLNIDLAPTFLDIANVDIPNHMDGKSFLPTVLSEKKL